MIAKVSLRKKIFAGKRISPGEAESLFSWDIIELGEAADLRRRLVHPAETVGFILDRIINFTNICEAACDFCAFHAGAALKPYELPLSDILSKVEELSRRGTQVMPAGRASPGHTLGHLYHPAQGDKSAFRYLPAFFLSQRAGSISRRKSALPLDRVLPELKAAGLDSVPGAADLLVDRIRAKVSPKKLSRAGWVEVMRALHRHGMKSSATMTYGMGETEKERIAHLGVVRGVQDETGLFRAFIPWSFSPKHTRLESLSPATGLDYLKIVAVSRIFLVIYAIYRLAG